jgi:hypothetical protein
MGGIYGRSFLRHLIKVETAIQRAKHVSLQLKETNRHVGPMAYLEQFIALLIEEVRAEVERPTTSRHPRPNSDQAIQNRTIRMY